MFGIPDMITLDGSHGEGGGQIVRTALGLSAITGKPFEVTKIRANRPEPGLKNQHMYGIRSVADLCNAQVEGSYVGSQYLRFDPGKLVAKNLKIDVQTAGSITLILQSILLPCCFADKKMKIQIKGGTDTAWSMPIDYFREILLFHLKRYADFDFDMLKRGYFPAGGGEVGLKISQKYRLSDFNYNFDNFYDNIKSQKSKIFGNLKTESSSNKDRLELIEQGKLINIKGISHAAKQLQKSEVAERQARTAKLTLNQLGVPIEIKSEYNDALSIGSAIVLWANYSTKDNLDFTAKIGADALGERGKPAEDVGKEAAENLLKEIKSGAPIDHHLADNLIPWLGLFGGKIKVSEITEHTRTNIHVVEQFLGNIFDVDEKNKVISTKF